MEALQLLILSNVIIDQVGMCNTTLYLEGANLPAVTPMTTDKSYQRNIGGCDDTNDNFTDFNSGVLSALLVIHKTCPVPLLTALVYLLLHLPPRRVILRPMLQLSLPPQRSLPRLLQRSPPPIHPLALPLRRQQARRQFRRPLQTHQP